MWPTPPPRPHPTSPSRSRWAPRPRTRSSSPGPLPPWDPPPATRRRRWGCRPSGPCPGPPGWQVRAPRHSARQLPPARSRRCGPPSDSRSVDAWPSVSTFCSARRPAGSRVTYRTSGTTTLAARYVSSAAGVGADRSARSCKCAVSGDLPGLWRRTRENQRTPPLHQVSVATTRQRTPEGTQRQTSSTGRASRRSSALRDLLRPSTELAA
jgi:hypothetical protein